MIGSIWGGIDGSGNDGRCSGVERGTVGDAWIQMVVVSLCL